MSRDEILEFSLSPQSEKPQPSKHSGRVSDRYLLNGDYWDMFHNMMKYGDLEKYTIYDGDRLVCSVEAPQFTPFRSQLEENPRTKKKTHFVDLII